MSLRDEVDTEVVSLLQSLKALGDKNPDSPIGGAFDDFNRLLERAKEAFPDARSIQEMGHIISGDSLTTVVAKLSIIKGAIDATKSTPA
ncbi:MAG: hypothetical protein ACE5G5_03550 [Candidatus Methylomirabilales bacterium]